MNKTLERVIIGTSGIVVGAGLTLGTLIYFHKNPFDASSPSQIPQSSQPQIQGVYFSQKDDCSAHLIEQIKNAKESIYMEIYTFTDKDIADSLISAKRRGVEIKAIFDKKQSEIPSSLDEYIENAGIPVKFEGGAGIMHNKVLIIDKEIVTTGSFNYTKSADKVNNENVVIIQDPAVAGKYFSEFEHLWQISKKR